MLFLNTKAVYDERNGLLVIEFPAENSFAFKAVQKSDVQDAVGVALSQACGEALPFAYAQAGSAPVPAGAAVSAPAPRPAAAPAPAPAPRPQPAAAPSPRRARPRHPPLRRLPTTTFRRTRTKWSRTTTASSRRHRPRLPRPCNPGSRARPDTGTRTRACTRVGGAVARVRAVA